jgi:hypothetical protein
MERVSLPLFAPLSKKKKYCPIRPIKLLLLLRDPSKSFRGPTWSRPQITGDSPGMLPDPRVILLERIRPPRIPLGILWQILLGDLPGVGGVKGFLGDSSGAEWAQALLCSVGLAWRRVVKPC